MMDPRFNHTSELGVLTRLENSPLAVIEWDSQCRVTRWSPRAQEIFGWSAEEVAGKHPTDWKFVHGEDASHIDTVINQLISGEWRSETVHNRNYTKDGRILNCAWYNSLRYDEGGHLSSIFSLVLDETESKRNELELDLQRTRLQFALESSEIGGWDWDLTEDRVTWFGCMSRIFETPTNDYIGDLPSSYRFVHHDDQDGLRLKVEHAVAERGSFEHEFRLILPSGGEKWIKGRGQAYTNAQGQVVRMIGTCAEITKQKNEEVGLKLAKSQAEVTSAQKSAFLANMSHEIRTPLGVILGFAELLSDPELDPGERADYMNIISRNGEHLSRLINDILDLSKVEAGKIEIYSKDFSIRCVMSDVVESLRAKAEEKNLKISWECDEDLPQKIFADSLRIKQILINLAGNALKFTQAGEIRVRALIDKKEKKLAHIFVEDTGLGISSGSQKSLFQPFCQGDHEESQAFGGTGLGLTLSRKIARLMGGEITLLNSDLGRGSVFEFAFPFQTAFDVGAEVLPPAIAEPVNELPLRGLRLLLAEDAVDVQVLMERILIRRGATIEIAKDGEEALDLAMHEEFDAVLMDIQMPGIDGYETTRRLRRDGYKKPIIALTAHAMKEERNLSLQAGCDDHLAKPVNPAALVRTILNHTHHHHS